MSGPVYGSVYRRDPETYVCNIHGITGNSKFIDRAIAGAITNWFNFIQTIPNAVDMFNIPNTLGYEKSFSSFIVNDVLFRIQRL